MKIVTSETAISTTTIIAILFFGMSVFSIADDIHQSQDAKRQKLEKHSKASDTGNLQKLRWNQERHDVQQHAYSPQEQQVERRQESNQKVRREQSNRQNDSRVVLQGYRALSWRTEHRTWRQRGGYYGDQIPKDNFRRNFGRNHRFHVIDLSFGTYGGRPRFQWGGFWFSIVDPVPEYWSVNWYTNDDVYIDYLNDGYYLCNRRHPHDRIAVTISLE
jgi:site-specific DNA-cytosine methylase